MDVVGDGQQRHSHCDCDLCRGHDVVAYGGMGLVERLRIDVGSSGSDASVAFDEQVVSAIGCDSETGSSQERYKAWRETQVGARPTEYLLPRVVRRIECVWPGFMQRAAHEMSDA